MAEDDLPIRGPLVLPARELHWRFSRSSGPGGQGVNTADSRVELSFDLAGSPSFPQHLRERARERLAGMLRAALAPDPPSRRPTRPTKGSQRRRLDAKARRGAVKRLRGRPTD
jgi:ribosome-associated protein